MNGTKNSTTPGAGVVFSICARVGGSPTSPSILHARGKKLGLGFFGGGFRRVRGFLFWPEFGNILVKTNDK